MRITKAFERAGIDYKEKSTDMSDQGEIQPKEECKTIIHAESTDYNENIGDLNWDERLKIASDPATVFSETFRQMRARILYSYNDNPPRTILVASYAEGEGKGFVCSNLGIAMARGIAQHALLVDCDLRRPTLAGLFGLDNNIGLVDFLQGNAELETLIKKTALPKLSIIPAGRSPRNPAEILSSDHMVSLVYELRSRYGDRFILLDSPPVFAASEAEVLAKLVDGILLVVRWGEAGREQIKRLVDTMGKEKIIGVIFNADHTNMFESVLYKKRYYGYYHKKY